MTPENIERRQQYEAQHAVTDPSLKAIVNERAQRAIERAKALADIVSVVTIRTNPKRH